MESVEDHVEGPAELSEVERVQCWRFEILVEAGYPPLVASALAASRADLHQAARMLLQGCSPRLAADILL
ncbi:MAG: hypothetical protein ACKVUT_00820 [Gaiella sp.]